MAMGKRDRERQDDFWVKTQDLPRSLGHPFYAKLNEVLGAEKFDDFVEGACAAFYADKMGRPSLPPGIYFRCMMVGYLEGIDSERGIAWRCADSLSLRSFLGVPLGQNTPDHSTLSRTRRLIDLETHQEVFGWMLTLIATHKLVEGKTLGIDSTTLEANAAMRSIVRRDTKETYEQFLTELAKASGIQTPTREDLARIDKNRKNKGSNQDWEHPHDPDAKITRMKDGSTHLAHKMEIAADMESGAVLGVTLQAADLDDRATMPQTIMEATEQLDRVREDQRAGKHLAAEIAAEAVADKGYHSDDALAVLEELGIRGYVSEPNRGRRKWKGKEEERRRLHANRRRIRGARGKRLMRRRGELIERPFAHGLETGGMRRTHLKGRENILKRLLIHMGSANLGLLLRTLFGMGTPRSLQDAGKGGDRGARGSRPAPGLDGDPADLPRANQTLADRLLAPIIVFAVMTATTLTNATRSTAHAPGRATAA
jgi:transposase